MIFGAMDADNWGNVAEWAGAAGTVAAFGATYRLLRHELEMRRSEQARLVSCWVVRETYDEPEDDFGNDSQRGAFVTCHNRSQEPIFDVLIHVEDQSVESMDVLPPGEPWREWVPVIAPRDVMPLRASMSFRDAGGIEWERSLEGELKRR
jgi:hypothetical protein